MPFAGLSRDSASLIGPKRFVLARRFSDGCRLARFPDDAGTRWIYSLDFKIVSNSVIATPLLGDLVHPLTYWLEDLAFFNKSIQSTLWGEGNHVRKKLCNLVWKRRNASKGLLGFAIRMRKFSSVEWATDETL